MTAFFKKIKQFDFFLIGSATVISVIGLLSIRSSTPSLFSRQLIFVCVGFVIMYVMSLIDWRVFRDSPYFILALYFLSVALLVGLFFFAPVIRDVQRWYKIGPILIDPAEFVKFIVIILLAKYFSKRHAEMYNSLHIVLSGIYVLIPALLIFLQPDLGSALVLIFTWVAILVISGIKLRHFAVLCLIGALIFSLGWSFFLRDYQKDRVVSFISPELDPQGIGWGQGQARIAVGNGGVWGQGLGSGSQTQYGFLPEPQTDFIFAAIAEEMGFVGVIVLVTSFCVLLWRLFRVAFLSKTNFPRLFISGFIIVITVQAFVNIGMNLGIMPIIGTPLPLVSYGGSNLLFVFAGLGMVQSFRTNQKM